MSFNLNLIQTQLLSACDSIECLSLNHEQGVSSYLETIYLVDLKNSLDTSKLDEIYFGLSEISDPYSSDSELFCSSLNFWIKKKNTSYNIEARINENHFQTSIGALPRDIVVVLSENEIALSKDEFTIIRIELDATRNQGSLMSLLVEANPELPQRIHNTISFFGKFFLDDIQTSLSDSIKNVIRRTATSKVEICTLNEDSLECTIEWKPDLKERGDETPFLSSVHQHLELIDNPRPISNLKLQSYDETEISIASNNECVLNNYIKSKKINIRLSKLDTLEAFEFENNNQSLDVIINQNHPFYKNIYCNIGVEGQKAIELMISSFCHLSHITVHKRVKEENRRLFSAWSEYIENSLEDILNP